MASSSNYFELLGVPMAFSVSLETLDRNYRELQSKVHPDRFANGTEAERRVAMQLATEVNDAYQTLKTPLRRAIYLLKIEGIDVCDEKHTAMDQEFLIQQLDWRENIEDARAAKNLSQLESLSRELSAEKRARLARLEAWFNSAAMQPAAEAARQLLFIEKLEQDIGDGMEALEQV
ncbi:MAG: Fe-S protein assembly co-chaperone HscB [Burkholderiales bacterium]